MHFVAAFRFTVILSIFVTSVIAIHGAFGGSTRTFRAFFGGSKPPPISACVGIADADFFTYLGYKVCRTV